MTKKEQILQEYYETLVAAGVEETYARFETKRAKRRTIEDLREAIGRHLACIEANVREKRRRDFYATEEGIKFQEELTAQREQIADRREKLSTTFAQQIDTILQAKLSDLGRYHVSRVYDDRICLDYFGNRRLTIEIYYGSRRRFAPVENQPTINVAACGSISVDRETQERGYYIAVGALFGASELLSKIYEAYLVPFREQDEELSKEIDRINDRLKNPFEEEK